MKFSIYNKNKIIWLEKVTEISILKKGTLRYKNNECHFLEFEYIDNNGSLCTIGFELYCDIEKAHDILDEIFDRIFNDNHFYKHKDFKK